MRSIKLDNADDAAMTTVYATSTFSKLLPTITTTISITAGFASGASENVVGGLLACVALVFAALMV